MLSGLAISIQKRLETTPRYRYWRRRLYATRSKALAFVKMLRRGRELATSPVTTPGVFGHLPKPRPSVLEVDLPELRRRVEAAFDETDALKQTLNLSEPYDRDQLKLRVGEPILRRFNWTRDYDAVVGFQEDNFSLNFTDFIMTRRFEEAFRRDLRHAVGDRTQGIFIIEVDEEVVAFLWIAIFGNNWTGERYGYVNNLYVRPDFRHQGLGKQLMEKAEAFFRSRGIRKVRLTVSSNNPPAVNLYQKMGYRTERLEMEKELR